MEKKLLYNEYKKYVLNELRKINSVYANLAFNKIDKLDSTNTKEIQHTVFSVNEIENSKIGWYWEWYRYIKGS